MPQLAIKSNLFRWDLKIKGYHYSSAPFSLLVLMPMWSVWWICYVWFDHMESFDVCLIKKKEEALMCVTGSESLIVIVLSGITESGFKGNWTLYPLHFACRCFDHTLKHSVYHHVQGYFHCRCKFPSSSFVPLRLILGSLTSLFLSPQGRDIPIVRRVIKVKLPHYHLSLSYLYCNMMMWSELDSWGCWFTL